MSESSPPPSKGPKEEGKLPGKDISHVLTEWEYEPGAIKVRKILGTDGQPKLQMRLDLGLYQMELNGRPDGAKPEGHESLLEFFESELAKHTDTNGTDLGFHLTRDQCRKLREEATMYYQRYLSLFVLEEYPGVIRDTERNLRVLDLCHRFAMAEADRLMLEVYRPYIVMMNARAKAKLLQSEDNDVGALKAVKRALGVLRRYYEYHGHPEAYKSSTEGKILRRIARDIRDSLPIDPLLQLQTDLKKAIAAENYEKAAELRDKLKVLEDSIQRPS